MATPLYHVNSPPFVQAETGHCVYQLTCTQLNCDATAVVIVGNDRRITTKIESNDHTHPTGRPFVNQVRRFRNDELLAWIAPDRMPIPPPLQPIGHQPQRRQRARAAEAARAARRQAREPVAIEGRLVNRARIRRAALAAGNAVRRVLEQEREEPMIDHGPNQNLPALIAFDREVEQAELLEAAGRRVPEMDLQGQDDGAESGPCMICLASVQEEMRRLACGHELCRACITRILANDQRPGADGVHLSCPFCRAVSNPANAAAF